MVNKILDHAEKITALISVIISLCEEHNLPKFVIADDFVFALLGEDAIVQIVQKDEVTDE